jgi:hypothetical protein
MLAQHICKPPADWATGPLNVLAPMTLIAAGMTFAWPHARTKASLIVVAALYGQVRAVPDRIL